MRGTADIVEDKTDSKLELPHTGVTEKIRFNSTCKSAVRSGHMAFVAFQSPSSAAHFQENMHPVKRN